MRRSKFNIIKDILKDYPDLESYINNREMELRNPYREMDVNSSLSGSKRDNDSMGRMLITIDQDRRLTNLRKNKQAIDRALEESDGNTKKIIHELYIKRYPNYTFQGLVTSNCLDCGRNKALKLRDKFFERLADLLELPI